MPRYFYPFGGDRTPAHRGDRLISYESGPVADWESVDISNTDRRVIGRSCGADTFERSMRRAKSLVATLGGGLLILDPRAFPIVMAEHGPTALEDGKEGPPHGHDDDYRAA